MRAMSDAVAQFPPDPLTAVSSMPLPEDRMRAWRAGQRDPALQLPLGPGQDQDDHEQVIIDVRPRLDDDEIASLLNQVFREAKIYDDRLQIARAAAFRLYNGEPMGDEEPGRSSIVLTEVRDSITAVMPTMMRVFAGAEHPVEFLPRADGDDDAARQAQDYVQHVCFTENDGWRALHDAITDAFQLKVGWLKWWWDFGVNVKTEHYFGLLDTQMQALINEPGVKAMRVVRRKATPSEQAGIMSSPESQVVQLRPGQPMLVFDAQITRKSPRNRPRLMAVPSEQILIDSDSSGPNDPCLKFIGHWRIVTVSDLIALGFPRDLVESRITQLQQQTNRVTRRRDRLAAIVPRGQSNDPSMRRVRYLHCWMRFDIDGDGIAELHEVHAIGDYGFLVLAHSPASRVQLARVCPFMVPHRAIGESFADRVGDLQRAMTRVFRSILDSLSESIHPRTVIHEGQVPVDDVLNTEMGAVIRERTPNSVRELTKPFVGPAALPLLEALGTIKEGRTGITKASQGLNADVLQSTTAVAVAASVTSAQDRLELIVRTVAEGIRDLYEGMLALMCEHQDRARVVLLRGKWTPVDPRAWMSGFNIIVKVGVGRGTLNERIQVLGAIAQQQKEAIQTMGPSNPVCGLGQLRNTISDMANAAGIMDVGRYFNPLPTNFQYNPPAPPPSSDMIIAQAEASKVSADAQGKAAQDITDRLEALLNDDRLRDEGKVKAALEAIDLMGKYGRPVDVVALTRLLDRNPASDAMRLAKQAATPPVPAPPAGAGGAVPPGQPAAGPPGGPNPGAPPAAVSPPGGGQPAAGPPSAPGGLGQRLFLPPALITALAAANRSTPPALMPPMPMRPPAPTPLSRPGAAPGFQ
jgi:hypothetical protein